MAAELLTRVAVAEVVVVTSAVVAEAVLRHTSVVVEAEAVADM
jgi:hypothetical protein